MAHTVKGMTPRFPPPLATPPPVLPQPWAPWCLGARQREEGGAGGGTRGGDDNLRYAWLMLLGPTWLRISALCTRRSDG